MVIDEPAALAPAAPQALAGIITWVSRKLLPDGSRKPESIP